jgi:hypothetical protein
MQVRFQNFAGGVPVEAVNRPRKSGNQGLYLYTRNWGQAVSRLRRGYIVHVKVEEPLNLDTTIQGTVTRVVRSGRDVPVADGEYIMTIGSRHRALARKLNSGTRCVLRGRFSGNLTNVKEAIGGGPCFLRGRKTSIDFENENFSSHDKNYLIGRHPRSVVGYNEMRTVLFLVFVEGRHPGSRGISLNGIAQLMRFLGAWDAMLFDGGGSATLYLGGELVMHKGEDHASGRRIGNALVLMFERKAGQ